jgi:regulator of PEP synthase PpsR (kinase-PPPase family)
MALKNPNAPPIYIVSGGTGASGEQLVHTILVQFPGCQIPVITIAHVRQVAQLEAAVARAATDGGFIVHTLVNAHLRHALNRLTQERHVAAIDLMGNLFDYLSRILGQEPAQQPGLYRQLHQDYFERVAAIEFTIAHDDGQRSQDWPLADIILVGVSRVGKTPLSIYLSVLGWKVANAPLVPGLSPEPELFKVDHRRVIGLNIEPGQLLAHRQQRQQRLGTSGPSAYTDPAQLYEEVMAARRLFKQGGFSVIDVTDKPIEASADDIIKLMARLDN